MATLKDAINWLATTHFHAAMPRKLLQQEFDEVLKRPEISMIAALWCESPADLAVKVLKAAKRKVPRDWSHESKPTGRFATRQRLTETVWLMAGNRRLTSEIARAVELSPAQVDRILDTGEGQPEGFVLAGHFRGKARRGVVGSGPREDRTRDWQ